MMKPEAMRRNTLEGGQVTLVVFRRKKDRWFTGVALELDIVEEMEDPLALLQSLTEAVWLHVRGVVVDRLSHGLLNRWAPASYWRVHEALRAGRVPRSLRPVYFVFTIALPALVAAKQPAHVTPRAPELATARG
ncbi:MAG: hypothetical protein G01um101438_685 [Parcubacteria group bacterium Gr01-1014_38]|nr:MAG: hypothetical protein G01um101438_685 [Parcubacteria group bacterium Gr01-1014_38]